MPKISKNQMALLHIAKAQLMMSDTEYINLLLDHGGVSSSKFLESSRFERVLDAFKAAGFVGTINKRRGSSKKPVGSKPQLISKISAQLNAMSLPWAYAVAIAKKSFKVDSLEWCSAEQLRKIVAMLTYRQRRQGKTQAECAR